MTLQTDGRVRGFQCPAIKGVLTQDSLQLVTGYTDYPQSWTILMVVMIVVFVAFYATSLGNLPWHSAELFPLEIRGLGSSLLTASCWACNILISGTALQPKYLKNYPLTSNFVQLPSCPSWTVPVPPRLSEYVRPVPIIHLLSALKTSDTCCVLPRRWNLFREPNLINQSLFCRRADHPFRFAGWPSREGSRFGLLS